MFNNMSVKKTAIFHSVEEVYTIPALWHDKDKNILLAFTEKWKTKEDHTSEALVMKTGKVNKDQTTNKVTVVWSDLKLVKEAHLKGYHPMNPCAVYDKTNKKLFLFFIYVEGTVQECWQICNNKNKARLCYITSTDAGQTWSPVTDLTDTLAEIKQWATFAVGPGHGTQAGSGRLIVPVYTYASCCNLCHCKCHSTRVPLALCLYSDDNGASLQFGNMLGKHSVECEIAEICDDKGNWSIYCNTRTKNGHSVEAVSHSDGEEFSILKKGILVETGKIGYMGSVVSFPAQNECANTGADQSQHPKWFLFAHPNDKDERSDLAVYLNKTQYEPNKWSKPWIINKGPRCYSDLAYIGDGMFACLMECGVKSETDEIAFLVFSYSDVEQAIK